MRWSFLEYLDSEFDRAIASALNCDGIACPFARRTGTGGRRLAEQTIRAVLENPRYTGLPDVNAMAWAPAQRAQNHAIDDSPTVVDGGRAVDHGRRALGRQIRQRERFAGQRSATGVPGRAIGP